MITQLSHLTDEQRAQVESMAAESRRVGLVAPLNEAAQLALAGRGSAEVTHWLLTDEQQPIGYAQLDQRDRSVQLMVDPQQRRKGHGRRLADQVIADARPQTWWAFGDLPGAQELARSLELRIVRALLIMTLDLDRLPPIKPSSPPTGITIDHYRPTDRDALVAVNALAFADHPEQGALTADDLAARMAADWYRDEDLLVARDASGQLVGFHWTKLTPGPRKPVGEVYVLGVHPSQAGQGTGRALLEAGIMHMRSRDARLIELYVEASNERAVSIYRSAGFEVTRTDVAYGAVEED